MRQFRTSFAAKAAAFLLALAIGVGGFWASLFILSQWDTLWTGTGYYTSNSYYQDRENRFIQARELAYLIQYKEWEGNTLPYLDQQRLEDLQDVLSPANTNFRFAIRRNDTGALIYTNGSTDRVMEEQVYAVEREAVYPSLNTGLQDDVFLDESGQAVLQVNLGNQFLTFTPNSQAGARQYGYTYDPWDEEWYYNPDDDGRVLTSELVLEYGVTDPLTVEDEFWLGQQEYGEYARYLPALGLLALALDAAAVFLLVFFFRGAGWRPGAERPVAAGFARMPLDGLGFCLFFAIVFLTAGGDSITYAISSYGLSPVSVTGLGLVSCGFALCVLGFAYVLTVQVKTRSLLQRTLVSRLARLTARAVRAMARAWPLTWRAVLAFGLYVVLCFFTFFLLPLLWLLLQGVTLWLVCRWTLQWKHLQEGTDKILGGEPDHHIDTEHMFHDLATHAGQLNDLGRAVGAAVEERIQSERFRAELITNVSHDLKTPLTSIINYVDLLKKQGLDSPRAPEYLEVLDRKSQRLKKLTEDLVEASKASTGSLSVHLERLGMVQLFQQALGEFQERFAQTGLTLVPGFPAEELWIPADGRHLWRVIDNLLSNCNKYAQPGTRIYADIFRQEGRVVLTIKNVSRQQLNIPAERLMERFVRGDEARSTEGSGLGLSIARSLTELQGGQFHIEIDGDLFKAVVSFPDASEQLPIPVSPPPAGRPQ